MESTSRLEIVGKREINHRFYYFLWMFVYLYAVSYPFIVNHRMVEFLGRGEETRRLQHDIETLTPQPSPTPNMWIDYHSLKNGSSYVPVGLRKEGFVESFITFFQWIDQMTALVHIATTSFQLLGLNLWLVVKRLGKRRLFIFLLLVLLFSYLLTAAMDGLITIIHSVVRDNFITWVESNIVQLDLSSDFQHETVIAHPFTQGREAPFFLRHLTRYEGEDVVFRCEYEVFGSADVEPYSIKTWWRKNGVPIQETDRTHVHVNIERIEGKFSFKKIFQSYVIRSTLTIEILQLEDYGAYTCDYINPMPMRMNVKPYAPKNNTGYSKAGRSEPMSPNPECHCQPKAGRSEPMSPNPKCHCQPKFKKRCTHSKPRFLKVCFGEFVLKAPPRETRKVKVHAGGISIIRATYRTVASVEDVKVDVTDERPFDDKGNYSCCSLFIKIYWQIFHFGASVHLPVSRLVGQHNENFSNYLDILKYSCVCENSNGLLDFTFYRNYFNTTTREQEEIEIKHPVRLFSQPEDGGSVTSFLMFIFCSSKNSDKCWCWCLEKLLLILYYKVYTYDLFMFAGMIMIFYFMKKFIVYTANLVAKPLRRVCFSNFQNVWQFPAVHGPPLHLHSQEIMPSYEYDVYLSYSEDDMYDSEVALNVKRVFEQTNLTVFDSVNDIMPGRLVAYESTKSLQHSRQFVMIVSKTFTKDNSKKMEFVAIQDTIVRRGSAPKDCLLIIQVEACDIVGLHRVPCIHVPNGLKETFALDQSSLGKLSEWICTTRPIDKKKTALGKIVSRLHLSGFTIRSTIYIFLLVYLALQSSIARIKSHCPD